MWVESSRDETFMTSVAMFGCWRRANFRGNQWRCLDDDPWGGMWWWVVPSHERRWRRLEQCSMLLRVVRPSGSCPWSRSRWSECWSLASELQRDSSRDLRRPERCLRCRSCSQCQPIRSSSCACSECCASEYRKQLGWYSELQRCGAPRSELEAEWSTMLGLPREHPTGFSFEYWHRVPSERMLRQPRQRQVKQQRISLLTLGDLKFDFSWVAVNFRFYRAAQNRKIRRAVVTPAKLLSLLSIEFSSFWWMSEENATTWLTQN